MGTFSRRAFLARSSVVAAAAGIASTVPGLTNVLGATQEEAPVIDGTGADAVTLDATGGGVGAADPGAPLVAHVRDLSTGEIAVFNGTREVIVRDTQLANNLLRAAR